MQQANAAVIMGIRSPAALSKAVLEKKNYLAAMELALKKHPDTTKEQVNTVAKCKLEKVRCCPLPAIVTAVTVRLIFSW